MIHAVKVASSRFIRASDLAMDYSIAGHSAPQHHHSLCVTCPWTSRVSYVPGLNTTPATKFHSHAAKPLYSPRSRPISSFMISFDPAQILVTRASFHARAARYSFMNP
ncbi:hypothetical protein VF34_00882 [Rhodococcus sp. PML026]|nr:hypothetical protein VF34_00882 [Rhodococcus sp. PML026]